MALRRSGRRGSIRCWGSLIAAQRGPGNRPRHCCGRFGRVEHDCGSCSCAGSGGGSDTAGICGEGATCGAGVDPHLCGRSHVVSSPTRSIANARMSFSVNTSIGHWPAAALAAVPEQAWRAESDQQPDHGMIGPRRVTADHRVAVRAVKAGGSTPEGAWVGRDIGVRGPGALAGRDPTDPAQRTLSPRRQGTHHRS